MHPDIPAQKKREAKFVDVLDDLFDVAQAEKLTRHEKRRQKREEVVKNRKRKEKLRLEVEATKNTFEESNDESEAICDEERGNSFAGPINWKNIKTFQFQAL